MPEEAQDLLAWMLRWDPEARATITDAIQHVIVLLLNCLESHKLTPGQTIRYRPVVLFP